MKRMMPAMFLSAILLSGCYDDYYFEESETTAVSKIQTTAESAEEESTEDSTDAPILMDNTAPPPPEDASEQEPQENPPEPPDEPEPSEDISEVIELDTAEQPTTEPKFSTETTTTETTTSDETEPSEPEQTTETAISEPTAEPLNHYRANHRERRRIAHRAANGAGANRLRESADGLRIHPGKRLRNVCAVFLQDLREMPRNRAPLLVCVDRCRDIWARCKYRVRRWHLVHYGHAGGLFPRL